MPTLPEQFDHASIHCYRSADDPNTLLYIPGAPTPQRTPDHAPMISLMSFAPYAFLQISTVWEARDGELAALRAALAQANPDLDVDAVRLALAPLAVERAALELTQADGSAAELQSTSTSGMPPFSALFNLQLDDVQQVAVASALNGRAGVLAVRYHATLALPQPAEVRIAGDVAPDLAGAGALADRDAAAALLDAAIERGHLSVTCSGAPQVPEARWQALVDEARGHAADLLLRMAAGATDADAAHFTVAVADTAVVRQPLERASDVADWFPPRGGIDHFQVIGIGNRR